MNRRLWIIGTFCCAMVLSMVWSSIASESLIPQFTMDYQKSGNFFTLMKGVVQGKSPHGNVQIWYSNNLKELISKPEFKAPVGAMAIKPYANGKKKGIAVMIKKNHGFDPKHGDWYYEMRTPDGKLVEKRGKAMAGKLRGCIRCHKRFRKSDYLAGMKLR